MTEEEKIEKEMKLHIEITQEVQRIFNKNLVGELNLPRLVSNIYATLIASVSCDLMSSFNDRIGLITSIANYAHALISKKQKKDSMN